MLLNEIGEIVWNEQYNIEEEILEEQDEFFKGISKINPTFEELQKFFSEQKGVFLVVAIDNWNTLVLEIDIEIKTYGFVEDLIQGSD